MAAAFRLRNFLCDYSLSPSTDLDAPAGKGDVPVIHVFGATEDGTKACVHIHGALPYLVIRVGGDLTHRVSFLMTEKLNKLLHAEVGKKKFGEGEAPADSRVPPYIHHLEAFQARSLYGFHSRMETFVKVYFTNPYYVTKLSAILGQVSSENPMLQPFEAHVPFVLQFFIDHSIFGMDWVSFRKVKYRIAQNRSDSDVLFKRITVEDVRMGNAQLSPVPPSTSCWVEVDTHVNDILNAELHAENVHSSNPGLEYIWKEEAGRCKLQNRPLVDAFNEYTPRPYPVIRTEKETLSTLRYVARKMQEDSGESGEGVNLDETMPPSPQSGSSYNDGKEAEAIWSQVIDETKLNWNGAVGGTANVDWDLENEDWQKEEGEEEAEGHDKDVAEMSMLVTEAGVKHEENHVFHSKSDSQEFSAVEKNIKNTINCPQNQLGGVWLKPKYELPLRRRLKKKRKPLALVAPAPTLKQEAKEELPTKAVRIHATMRNHMLFTDETVERTDLEQSVSPDNVAMTDGHIEETKNVCVASLEVFVFTQHEMPDPHNDPILAVSLCIATDACCTRVPSFHSVITVIAPEVAASSNTIHLSDEKQIFEQVVEIITRFDPDVLIGYDVDRLSWGYLVKRSEVLGGADTFIRRLGRYVNPRKPWQRDESRMPDVDGRLVESVWRMVRRDLQLRSYDRGTACLHILKQRTPVLSDRSLSQMYTRISAGAGRPIHLHIQRLSQLNISLLYKMDWFIRNAEMARVYGIQFHEVWTRGSQLRVESMLLRLAHKLKFVAPSVTPDQRAKMCAPEQLQLILEPQSKVYHDPVIVLDFQSLYPSMVIAYNYCFSTLFGKIPSLAAAADVSASFIELGALQYSVDRSALIEAVSSKDVHSSPLSAAYAKVNYREGVVPKMLREILGARIMVKTAMKHTKSKRVLRILEARQLALKLVANVTYGYTAANWSGRMPCVEVADAILAKGRETLERAIAHVNEGDYGGARVIYGDTDSMFVLVPGATVEHAFSIGKKIAAAVTNDNPDPVVLKLEKVYSGCVLETKKRYAGWMYETETSTPKLDAKGIETVRRDTCPIVAKILERSLELILQRKYSKFYSYLDRKLSSLQNLHFTEFIFCKEFRGEYDPDAPVPQKKIAIYNAARNPGYFPLRGERMPYIVVTGEPDSTVISCVRSLDQFLADSDLKINVPYYVRAHILAALRRVTDLIPMAIEYVYESGRHCFSERCTAVGYIPWCGSCRSDNNAYTFAILNVAREQRIMAAVRKVCADCQHSREVDIEACGNFSCTMHRLISSVSRSVAPLALFQHACYCTRNEIPPRGAVERICEEPIVVEELTETDSEEDEEFRPNSTILVLPDDDEYSRL